MEYTFKSVKREIPSNLEAFQLWPMYVTTTFYYSFSACLPFGGWALSINVLCGCSDTTVWEEVAVWQAPFLMHFWQNGFFMLQENAEVERANSCMK